MDKSALIYVAGHNGMVGSALVRRLRKLGYENLLMAERSALDLCRQTEVELFLNETRPDAVIVAAAKVGGIHANRTFPAEFIYDNLAIALNVINGAWRAGAQRLIFLYLSQDGTATDTGECAADKPTGTYQRSLRAGQNCRPETMSALPGAIRGVVSFGNAHQYVRAQ